VTGGGSPGSQGGAAYLASQEVTCLARPSSRCSPWPHSWPVTTGPAGLAEVIGTYALVAVSGQPVPTAGRYGVESELLALGADGAAVRRVRYAGATGEDAAAGTFVVRGDSVVLNLTTLASRPPVVVRWAAARAGGTLTLRFRDPGDGPDIVERYERQ